MENTLARENVEVILLYKKLGWNSVQNNLPISLLYVQTNK